MGWLECSWDDWSLNVHGMAEGLKTSSWDGCNVHGMDEKFMGWLHVVAGKFMGWMNVHWMTVW